MLCFKSYLSTQNSHTSKNKLFETGNWVFNKSKKEVENIFDGCINLINSDLIWKTYGRELMYAEQDLLSILLNSKYEIPEIYCPIFHTDYRPFENACLIHFDGKEYKYFIGEICNKKCICQFL